MDAYRIAACHYIHDLSGTGAALHGGRWNSIHIYMVYAASSVSLAMLELLAHVVKTPAEGYCMIRFQIPEDKIKILSTKDLPDNWYVYPAPESLKKIGDDFVLENKYLALVIPSAIIPEENNILVNPAHSDFKKIKIVSERRIGIDKRIKQKSG